MKLKIQKNPEKAPYVGSRFGQDVEPSGTYVVDYDKHIMGDNWLIGVAYLNNPLFIEVDWDTLVSWKYDLASTYKSKKAKLTSKLMSKGYDAIITRYPDGHYGEIILFPNANFTLNIQENKIIKIRITESQVSKILKENSDYEGIFQFINSGDEDNISLAFQLIDGLDKVSKEEVSTRLNAEYGALLKLLNIKTPMSSWAINLMFRRTTIIIDGVGYKELPYNIGILKDIKYISAPLNSLTSLPESIGSLINLEMLNLEHNYLTSLPNSIFNIKALDKIELKGNPITQDEIAKLKKNLPNTRILI